MNARTRPRCPTRSPTRVAALRAADDLAVAVEAYTTAGNVDLAVFSRNANAVLLVEHKTGTALSKWQITKYQLAMQAADPSAGRTRTLTTVLLRPSTNSPANRNADEDRFDRSVELNHEQHLSDVLGCIADELDGPVLAHAREPTTKSRQAAADNPQALLRRPLARGITHDVLGPTCI